MSSPQQLEEKNYELHDFTKQDELSQGDNQNFFESDDHKSIEKPIQTILSLKNEVTRIQEEDNNSLKAKKALKLLNIVDQKIISRIKMVKYGRFNFINQNYDISFPFPHFPLKDLPNIIDSNLTLGYEYQDQENSTIPKLKIFLYEDQVFTDQNNYYISFPYYPSIWENPSSIIQTKLQYQYCTIKDQENRLLKLELNFQNLKFNQQNLNQDIDAHLVSYQEKQTVKKMKIKRKIQKLKQAKIIQKKIQKPKQTKILEKMEQKPQQSKIIQKMEQKPKQAKIIQKKIQKPKQTKILEKMEQKPQQSKIIQKMEQKPKQAKIIQKKIQKPKQTKKSQNINKPVVANLVSQQNFSLNNLSQNWSHCRNQKTFKTFYQFLLRKYKWKSSQKESPNIFVYLVCNYPQNMESKIWLEIINKMHKQYTQIDDAWKLNLNHKLGIKLLKNQVECHKPKQQFLKPEQKNHLSYSLKNFKTLCKEGGIKQKFQERESFTSIQDKLDKELEDLDNELGDLKIKQEKKESIQSLKDLVQQIKYHKENNLTKKTINFNKKDILNLCKIQEIKQQVELIIKLIKSPDADFLKYIEINDVIVGHLQVLVEKVQEMNSKLKDG